MIFEVGSWGEGGKGSANPYTLAFGEHLAGMVCIYNIATTLYSMVQQQLIKELGRCTAVETDSEPDLCTCQYEHLCYTCVQN